MLAGGVVAAVWVARPYVLGEKEPPKLFVAKADRRLEVREQTSVDGRRKLVIIRRDNVEHLIMTGGPVDVVIETGIGEVQASAAVAPRAFAPTKSRASDTAEAAAVFTRQPRSFGRVAEDA